MGKPPSLPTASYGVDSLPRVEWAQPVSLHWLLEKFASWPSKDRLGDDHMYGRHWPLPAAGSFPSLLPNAWISATMMLMLLSVHGAEVLGIGHKGSQFTGNIWNIRWLPRLTSALLLGCVSCISMAFQCGNDLEVSEILHPTFCMPISIRSLFWTY